MHRARMISRNVLSGQVKDYLLKAILAGEYAPGSRIVETRVARELGISQGPVREALRDLEALGVIDSTPYQGARVRQPDKEELLEAYAVRAELESLGVRLALHRLTDRDLLDLERLHLRMQQTARAGNPLEQARIDVAFHSRIIELSGSRTLARVWRYLEPMSRTHITMVLPGLDPKRIADLHQPLIDALRDRNAVAATAAVHHHFRSAASLFQRLYVEPPEPAAEERMAIAAGSAAGVGARS